MNAVDCCCARILRFFSVASDGATANRQIPDRIFGLFFTSLMKDSVANYGSILTHFPPSVSRVDVLYIALNVSYLRRQVTPHDSQIYGGSSKTQKIGRRFVPNTSYDYGTIGIVINSTRVMGVRVTISCRYALSGMGEDMVRHFYTTLITYLDYFLPILDRKIYSTEKPWVNSRFRQLIKKRQNAYRSGDITTYRRCRNQVSRLARKLQAQFCTIKADQIHNYDQHSWWKTRSRLS